MKPVITPMLRLLGALDEGPRSTAELAKALGREPWTALRPARAVGLVQIVPGRVPATPLERPGPPDAVWELTDQGREALADAVAECQAFIGGAT